MEGTVRLRELVCSLEGGDDGAVQESVEFVRQLKGEWASQTHSVLCVAMLNTGGGGKGSWKSEMSAELLHVLGPSQALSVVYSSARNVSTPAVRWLAEKVLRLLSSGSLVKVMVTECREVSGARLTAQQEHLVGVLCRLPDVLSNRLRQHLDPGLLPQPYFSQLGADVFACLQQVHSILRASGDCSLLFPAAVVGKAALLGQKDAVFSRLVPSLEHCAERDHLWRRLAQTLFTRVPASCLEPVLDALLQYCSPSLLPMCPLRWLLGDLVPSSQRASFLLAHKLPLMKVPSSPRAVFTLVGYLAGCGKEEEEGVLGKTLQSVLGVWSDASALRHMDLRQHLWLSRVTVLGVACLSAGQQAKLKPALQRLVMAGLQVHLDSPLKERRHVGMAVGEGVMACLNPSDKLQLKFEYEPTEEVRAIQQLARPVEQQEKELQTRWREEKKELQADQEKAEDKVGQEKRREDGTLLGKEEEQPQMVPPCPTREQFGEGLVQTTECSDTDSDDDDLVPYAMGDDPDSTQPKQPRYLRTLIQVLVSGEALQQQGALRVAESLVLSRPPDLNEVCVELARVMLHLTDTYALSDFASLRHKALVALAVTCPSPTAHYLTSEFYAPNYTLRQRMDILEVLSSAALELAQPGSSDSGDSSDGVRGERGERGTKPWEEVVQQRLRAKTRIISKGPSKPPLLPSPNRFAPVAPTFFFPLMAVFDCPVATLDLLGRDSLVLGSLLHTLGTVMYCATNAPLAPTMAAALLDFLWALRYHNEAYVRQGVLFALSMLVVSTPILPTELEGGLTEAVHWVEGVHESDPDAQCRSLARQTLALLGASVRQTIGQQ